MTLSHKKPLQLIILIFCCCCKLQAQQTPLLRISENKRYFQTMDGKPFFWLGDTGWLLFTKTTKEEAVFYLDTRMKQGFNVIQVMVLHDLRDKNRYGNYALENAAISRPVIDNNDEHNYWSYIDFIITEAAKRNIYIALVPIWGGVAKSGKVTVQQATNYAVFLAKQFSKHDNIIWLNGGDIRGNEIPEVWSAIGNTLYTNDSKHHLIGFHPRGRYSSSEWFHNEAWLGFNMFQSGHRTYAQDTSLNDKYHYGEDNWKHVQRDYKLLPAKPVLDGEPSYENIPHGLHDSLMPRWNANDIRRYAYWSVFSGAAGFTYGENSVMQFYTTAEGKGAYGVNANWTYGIYSEGGTELHYLKELLTNESYFERVPAQEIISGNRYEKYDYVVATKTADYAMVYTYTGRTFSIDKAKLGFTVSGAQWFNPKSGRKSPARFSEIGKLMVFDPPGEPANGNDWVLILPKK